MVFGCTLSSVVARLSSTVRLPPLRLAASIEDGPKDVLADLVGFAADALVPPEAPRRPRELVTHGDARVDDYYWLRDDSRKDKEVSRRVSIRCIR